ncbi:MAG: hypothetical protein AAFQ82_17655, partial [Myxococcota bacterium]
RGEEHRHDALMLQIEWVIIRILRGLIVRAIRATKEPIRIVLTGFGPFEDQRGHAVPNNVTDEFVSSPSRLRGLLRGALPDISAPNQPKFIWPEPFGQDDVVVGSHVYDPHYRLGRPITLFGRTLPVDTHALSEEREAGLPGLLSAVSPHIYIGLGVRRRGAPEFVVEEVSDNSGLTLNPSPHHSKDTSPTEGHPLNRAAARAFAQGLQELGGYRYGDG